MRSILSAIAVATLGAVPALANETPSCSLPPGVIANVQAQLAVVVNLPDANGGNFKPNLMWSAVVDRGGHLCSVIKTGDAYPGSRGIAIAKASTANDFNNVKFAISTANLYAPTQPGGSLYGINNGNPFNPEFLPNGSGIGYVPGGIITFGGGVALYNTSGQVIGGLGVSGDSSCADHAIAFRMRLLAGLDNTPSGPNGAGKGSDNIIYGPTTASGNWHPHCSAAADLSPSAIAKIPGH